MENVPERYLAANRNFAEVTRDIEAIQAGLHATMRGLARFLRRLTLRWSSARIWVPRDHRKDRKAPEAGCLVGCYA
jgi:hypothetical protein